MTASLAISMVVALFALSAVRSARAERVVTAGQEVDHTHGGPLASFAFFVGRWTHPERDVEVVMEWGLEGRVVHWTEIGSFDGSAAAPFSQGLIGYNAAAGKVVFHDFFGPREMMFSGEFTVREDGALQRSFAAHYGEGWNDRPPPGSVIEFRETWEPVGDDGWRWSSEIFQNDEWRQYQPPVVMQRADG